MSIENKPVNMSSRDFPSTLDGDEKKIVNKFVATLGEDLSNIILTKVQNNLSEMIYTQVAVSHYRFLLPQWVKGDKKAGEVLGVSAETMLKRRHNGFYIEGTDWKKGDPKLKNSSILWNKDTLLKERERL